MDQAPVSPLHRGGSIGPVSLFAHRNVAVDAYGVHDISNLYCGQTDRAFALLLGSVPTVANGTVQRWNEEPERLVAWSTAPRLDEHNGAFILLRITFDPAGGYQAQLSTDKYGFRTLYYVREGSTLYVASHLSGLRGVLGEERISPKALRHYYHFGVAPSETTLIDGVKKVPAATVLTVNPGRVEGASYFDPLDLYEPGRYADADADAISREIDEYMTEAVSKRVSPGARVALAVSGGVDSGYIAQKLKQADVDFRGYNLAYGDYDEHDRVDQLATSLDLTIDRVQITAEEIIASFEASNALGSEPVAFNDAALRVLARRVRQDGFDVMWDGDGADRLFLGMNSHLKYQRVFTVYQLLQKVRLTDPLAQVLRWVGHPETRKLSTVLQGWSHGIPPYSERKYGAIKGFDAAFEEDIFELGVGSFWDSYLSRTETFDLGVFLTYFSIKKCPENFFRTPLEQQGFLGLMPVSPYWDDKLVSLALSVPTRMKLRGSKTKYVLRKAAALQSSTRYWMLPKIGLDSALACVRHAEAGKTWLARQRDRIVNSDEYHSLSQEVNEQKPDVDRLLPYLHWKEAHVGAAAL